MLAPPLRVERIGRIPYAPMLVLQEQRHAEVRTGEADDTLFLLEHPRVVTLGKNSQQEHLLVDRQDLASRGYQLYETGRGGDVTYHGPGQVVAYPILKLQEGERDIKAYVSRLEEIMIRASRDFGVAARRIAKLRGIWVGDAKIGAVGVRIAHWTTLHGFAFNVSTELVDYEVIVPCGLHGRGVTSLEKLLGTPPSLEEVEDRIVYHAGEVLGRRPYEARFEPVPEKPQRIQVHS